MSKAWLAAVACCVSCGQQPGTLGAGPAAGFTVDAVGADSGDANGADLDRTAATKAISAVAFCTKWNEIICTQEMACNAWTSKAACLASERSLSELANCAAKLEETVQLAAAGKLVGSLTALLACEQQQPKTCQGSSGDCFKQMLAFKKVAKPGESCLYWSQCGPAGHCAKADGNKCKGVCQSDLTKGQACSVSGPGYCGDGLYCDGKACAALKATGEPCADFFECGSGLQCQSGSCAKNPKPDPTVCGGKPTDGCFVGTASAYASSVACSGSCEPVYEHYQDKGAPCADQPVKVPSGFLVRHRCKEDLACDKGTCVNRLADGSPCEPAGVPCASDLCDAKTSTCLAFPTTAGATCQWVCGGGLVCDKGECRQPLPMGSPCESDGLCQSRNCEAGTCAAACAVP